AWDYEIEEALEEKVKIVNSLGPLRFYGDGNGRVNEVSFQECTAVFDEKGRFNPQYDDCKLTTYETATVIVAIGQMGETEYAADQGISLTPPGGLEADPITVRTPIDWVFAGGDAFYGPKSVVDAIASGKIAAESIDRFIKGEDLTQGREKEFKFEKPEIKDIPRMARVEPARISVEEREGNFKEVTQSLARDAIEKETARCLSCGICSECYQCVDACLAGAIDHDQQALVREVPVGSVILTTGAEAFDPSGMADTYLYGRSSNVMTSLEFERILSAGGPTMGHLVRPSDEKEPEKIAWLQCIGSRDTNRCGNGYCSSVCCMYAIKDAMIAKEHSEKELDAAIFNMDMRSFGKDYEKYYRRAADQDGVRFVKSRVHSVVEERGTGNLILQFADEAGQLHQETFDMVILSVGLTIPKASVDLAHRIGIELDAYNFVKTPTFKPLETSRSGVYVSGTFQGPKDIPSSVTEASGSAGAAGVHLASARHSLTRTVTMPDQRDVLGEDPRVGVFVCKCGINI
ncbi:MAG: FAD-dependent oxidoreductase, partial [Desulfovibrionales bacterium]|nr:FAD-dependent oxidoreductase [Desulfovibrionales bacterium]